MRKLKTKLPNCPGCSVNPVRLNLLHSTLLVVVSLAVPLKAMAAESQSAEKWMEEIRVTAEKRDENLLEVPLTMTAFSERMIEELGMTNAQDIEQLVPGLQFGAAALQQRSDGQGITIRGIGTQSARELHSDLAVAVYVDGVYTVDTYGLAPNLFDIERVEVARGPQGTLNGRNSIAGAIHFHSKRPDDEWELKVLSEFTDQFSQRYNIAFGGGIVENWSFRLAGGYYEGDGTQENTGFGDDLGAPDQTSIVPQIRFRNDVFDINLKYQNVRDKGSQEQLVAFAERDRTISTQGNWYLSDEVIPSIAACADPPISSNGLTPQILTSKFICDDIQNKISSNRSGDQDSETERYTFNFDWKLAPGLTVQYTFGQGDTSTLSTQDSDGTNRIGSAADPSIPADLDSTPVADCDFNASNGLQPGTELECWTMMGASFTDGYSTSEFRNEEESHELQIISDFEGKFNFVAGVYFYKNETFWESATVDFSFPFRNADADQVAANASPVLGVAVTSCQDMIDNALTPAFGNPLFGSLGMSCPEGTNHLKTASFFSGTTSETRAVFFNVDYDLNDAWSLSAGLRWTEDEKNRIARIPDDFVGANAPTPDQVPNGLFTNDLSFLGLSVLIELSNFAGVPQPRSWSDTIGHISVEYSPVDDRMYYGRISTGYRAGGFNFDFEGIKDHFDEETLINYETGIKGLFLDRRLQLTAGLFFQDYEGYQLTANQPIDTAFLNPTDSSPLREHTLNVESSTKIWGLEVEGVYYFNQRWRLSGYYAYQGSELGRHSTVVRADPDQEFVDYTYATGTGPDNVFGTADDVTRTVQIPQPRDHSGDELPQMPNHKGALTLAYTHPTERLGTLQLLSTLSYTGTRWPQRAGNIPRAEVPSYTRWDLRANWNSDDGQWSGSVFVQNVLDDSGIAESIAIDLRGALTEPRLIGLQLRWQPQL